MHFQNRTLRSIRIVFDPMAKGSHAIPKSGHVKGMMSAGIDYQFDGGPHFPRFRALALFGRRPPQRVEEVVMPSSKNLHKSSHFLKQNSLVTSLTSRFKSAAEIFHRKACP
jgi:hypothetical protein